MSTDHPTCDCGNQDLWVTAAIPVDIRISPSGVTLHLTRPGTHPDFQPWETAGCGDCGASSLGNSNEGLVAAIERAMVALTKVTADVRCDK